MVDGIEVFDPAKNSIRWTPAAQMRLYSALEVVAVSFTDPMREQHRPAFGRVGRGNGRGGFHLVLNRDNAQLILA